MLYLNAGEICCSYLDADTSYDPSLLPLDYTEKYQKHLEFRALFTSPRSLTRLLHASYTPLIRLLHASYTPLTRLVHASYTPLTRLSHASYTPQVPARVLHGAQCHGNTRRSEAKVLILFGLLAQKYKC